MSILRPSVFGKNRRVFRAFLAEDYDGIHQWVMVTTSLGSLSSAYRAMVPIGDRGTGQTYVKSTEVLVYSNRGKLEILSLGGAPSTRGDLQVYTGTDWKVWRESWYSGTLGGTPTDWEKFGFDDSGWDSAQLSGHVPSFSPGLGVAPAEAISSTTNDTLHWLARAPNFTLNYLPEFPLLSVQCDDNAQIYLNGALIHSRGVGVTSGLSVAPSAFRIGENSLAVAIQNIHTSPTPNNFNTNPTWVGLLLEMQNAVIV